MSVNYFNDFKTIVNNRLNCFERFQNYIYKYITFMNTYKLYYLLYLLLKSRKVNFDNYYHKLRV